MVTIYKVTRKLSLSNYKGKHVKCPNCGHVRLKLYAYEDGAIEHESLGRCQREVNCGYHLKPSEYFKEKGEGFYNTPTYSQPIAKETYFLPSGLCEKFQENFKASTLLQLLNKTGIDYTPIFQKYKVGAGKLGQTVFFQFDGKKYHTGKAIKYLEDGHRDKSDPVPVRWVHKLMNDFNEEKQEIKQCLFGLHLVNESNTICLVESEKTAIVCAGLFPNAVWLATGGRTQIQAVKINELGANKKVLVFPDTDSIQYWSDKTRSIGNCQVIDTSRFNKYCLKGADLADFLLESGPEIARQTMIFVRNLLF